MCCRKLGHVLVELIELSYKEDEEDKSDGSATYLAPVPMDRHWAPKPNSPKLGWQKQEGKIQTVEHELEMSDPDPHFCDCSNGYYKQNGFSTGTALTFLNSPFVPPNHASITPDSDDNCWECLLHNTSEPDSGPLLAELPETPRPHHKILPLKNEEPSKGSVLPPGDLVFQFADEPLKSPQMQPKAIQPPNLPDIDPQLRPRSLDYDDWASENPYLPNKLFSSQENPAGGSGDVLGSRDPEYGIENLVVEPDSDYDIDYDGLRLAHARLDRAETEAKAKHESGAAADMQGNRQAYEGKGKGKGKEKISTGKKLPDIVVTEA
ncbi:hypothetical protein F5Y06DRAFT_233086 [Hypoxylon sp. FL0890]|nr:hypothetical protein F5Y06DRAFT_233086 [Hypoxylon sp. FL0890]